LHQLGTVIASWAQLRCHTFVLKVVNRSFHTCAQDVKTTRMTNSKVNNS
jgi:hypothetical protein